MAEFLTTLDHIDRFLDDTKNQSLIDADRVRDFLLDLRTPAFPAAPARLGGGRMSEHNADYERPFSVIEALQVVHGDGWKTVREKSYYRAQERQRVAEALRKLEQEHNAHTRAWANKAFDEMRRLSDRCTYLYGLAASLGATEEQLRGAALIDGSACGEER